MLDTVRWWIAYTLVGTLAFALLFWYLIHGLIGFWRRVGALATYTVAVLALLLNLWAAWVWREPLLAVEYGTGPLLWIGAALAYAASIVVEVRCRRHLGFLTLVGWPELRPPEQPTLLDQGIYARIRHPRYVSVMLGVTAFALFCNYLAVWIVWVVMFPLLMGVVVLEERELRQRFGARYTDYSRRVPRFIPRFSNR